MNKLELLLHLGELNVKRIELEFSGSGDSGSIENVQYYNSLDKDEDPIKLESINDEAKDFIMNTADNILTEIEDWWNEDGGGGIMKIHIPEMTYEIENYTNIIQQEYYNHNGELTFKEE